MSPWFLRCEGNDFVHGQTGGKLVRGRGPWFSASVGDGSIQREMPKSKGNQSFEETLTVNGHLDILAV